MLKKFLEKWRLWEEALLGMDDLQGDTLVGLERRLARLETAVADLHVPPREGIPREDGQMGDKR
jgi:hypothetical protein